MPQPPLVKWLLLTLCIPLTALANPGQIGESDCKSLISHSGFAEFVLASEGGISQLAIQVGPSARWSVRNSGYVDWIEILEGDSGMGPGNVTVRLKANTSRFCRVGVLTISGLTRIYGLPITILQQGAEAPRAEKRTEPAPASVVNLAPFSSSSPQPPPNRREYKKVAGR